MNRSMIFMMTGRILLIEAFFLVLPLVAAFMFDEPLTPFLVPIALLCALGFFLSRGESDTTLYARDGFAVVGLSWLLMSLFGALPFVISGDIPNFVDAFFETVSGVTTTGATILPDVETLKKSSHFWRSLTHWIGGMGFLVFVMAVMPLKDGHGMHLMRAEMAGPSAGKLVSRMSDTAKILYLIYFVMTLVLIAVLYLCGMDFYESCIHAFGTAGTGGFSNRGLSVGAYDNATIDVVIGVSMLLFGVNFNLYYLILLKRVKDAFASEELRLYALIVFLSTLFIAFDINRIYGSFATSLRHSFFQVSSIITTTGFSTVDFTTWPSFSQMILVLLMFVGGCAGSTAGGIKVVRILVLAKGAISEMKKLLHPRSLASVRLDGRNLSEQIVREIRTYLSVYFAFFTGFLILLATEGFDFTTIFTATAACFNNIGPGLAAVGPLESFGIFSPLGKVLLSLEMLFGRLEIYPLLFTFAPSTWLSLASKKESSAN